MPNLEYEKQIRKTIPSCVNIAGIDEAGRGPLAGPVFAASVILPKDYSPEWLSLLDDSKKLSEKKREYLYLHIKEDPKILWNIAQSSVAEIEKNNILQATYLAMARAAKGLPKAPDHCLIDGNPVPSFPFPSTNLIKGDGKSYSIAAASILAKVARDHYMVEIAEEFPQYGFHKHKGYGTKAHLEALHCHGASPHHRKTFAPVGKAMENASS